MSDIEPASALEESAGSTLPEKSLPTSAEGTSSPTASPSSSAPSRAVSPTGARKPAKGNPAYRPGARARAEHRKWKRIEWVWTLVPIGLLIAVAVPSTILLYELDTGPSAFGAHVNWNVNVTGQQWLWTFKYTSPYEVPGAALPSNVSLTGYAEGYPALYVPQNAVVWINVTSVDVIHDFNVPTLGVRIDAIPGTINHYWFTIPSGTAPWTIFDIQCTEFCGQGHYNMLARLVVTPASCDMPYSGCASS